MHKSMGLILAFILLLHNTGRTESPKTPRKPADQPIREIFVPFEDLNVILDNDHQRVFLTREEYEELIKQAKAKPEKSAPHKVALIAAQYEGELADGRALIIGNLTIEVMEDGLFALPLDLAGVGIRSALLDGRPAPLYHGGSHQPTLLVENKGMHKLELQLTAPLQTAAAQQTLQFTLPTKAATRLKLTVPGNVEVKGGAAVVSRTYDMSAGTTRFEVLPQKGGMAITLSLNSRLLQQQRVIVARSVIVDEITQGYERIHATVSFHVLHGATEKLRLAVPAGFEAMKVESVLLSRWGETTEGGRKVLEMTLREPTSEQIVLHLTFNRSPALDADWLASLANWKFPRLEILDTAGQVAVIGLVVEDRLKPERIEATNLVSIDSAALASAIPASVLKAEPGAPVVRQVASYYAPAGDYSLSASFVRPPAELNVAGNSLIVIGDAGLTLQGGFALTPQAESFFSFSFVLATGWQVTQVTAADGTPLPIERYPLAGGGTRVLVRLLQGIPIGQTQTVNYHATLTPTGWLTEWTTKRVEVPRVLVSGATSDSGAVAAQTIDDLVVRPDTIAGLSPLLDNEKAAVGLGGLPTALAYRYENRDFSATLAVERTAASLAARVMSFLKLERDNLAAHYELIYDVREARTRQVAFSLPLATPTELTIRGLEGTAVKQFTSQDQGEHRRWLVQLQTPQLGQSPNGRVRLAIDFAQRMPETTQRNAPLPLIEAEDVTHQSGLIAIEGDAELDVSIKTIAREIDIGELAGAEHSLGRRIIGSFGYVGTAPSIQATITRRDPYALPPALIQRAELVTKVSASGRAQSVARYDLVTKATLLEIRLPAASTLWTIYLDDQPTKPQREKESLLLSLPAQDQPTNRKLQLVYESATGPLGTSGTIDATAPQLLVRAAGSDADREIPQADLQWQLILPSGYVVRQSGGTVTTDEIALPQLAAVKVMRFLYELGGGMRPWWAARNFHNLSSTTSTYNHVDALLESKSESAPYPASATPPPPGAAPLAGGELRTDEKLAKPAERREAALAASAKPGDMRDLSAQLAAEQENASAGRQMGRTAGNLGDSAAKDADAKRLWALEGVSTLKIDIEPDSARATKFRSLGDQPQLVASVIDERRIAAGAWGLAGLVILIGIGLTFQPADRQATYVILVLLAATVPVLVTAALDEFAMVFDLIFFAGCALALYFPLAAFVRAIARRIKARLPAGLSQPAISTVAGVLITTAFVVTPPSALAQSPVPDDMTPVAVPADAIIVPYDPEKPEARAASKILVPYPKYVELWNQAHPDKKIAATPSPVGYAIAGTAYETQLTAGDYLSLVGRMEIEVYEDKPVAVPLALAGGVLENANVDGQAARLQIVEPQASSAPNQQPAAAQSKAAAPSSLLLLHLSGKGRKSIELHVRLGLMRQGGWRVVRGQVPVGPAAALTLAVPSAGTEIRQTGLADRATFETKIAGERIETALDAHGQVDLQWRPKVGEGMVDQELTAHSIAAFDIREDSLRLAWQVHLDFGRAYRDAFSFTAPADYLVESVTGDNVRGWTVKSLPDEQRIDVSLLKPAQGGEVLTLQMAKRGRVGERAPADFDAPVILVEGAALEQGEIAVRKSPRLDLRTLESSGLARADSNRQTAAIEQLADAADAAVLVVRPYQTFRFVRPPYRLTLSASELPQEVIAEVRAALRIADRETTLDAAVIFRPQGPPLYRVRLFLPDGFTLDRVGPGDLEWSVTSDNGRQLLTVHLLDGRTDEFTLTLLGKFPSLNRAASEAPQPWSFLAPRIEVLDVQKQSGEIVILPDPDTDVRLDALRSADAGPLTTPPAWMKAEQQPLAKAALRFRAADYAATLHLTPRTPLISARTITNIKITPRSIEETVLLNFRIEQAGIRRVVFLVPEHLAKARLKARLVKQKTVTPATDAAGQPLAGRARMTLELQDYVRGDYSVLLEQDRLLATDRQVVALPVIETGRTDRRLVAIENAGRDEVVIDEKAADGLEPINRQQQAWRDLAAVLGNNVSQAFAARDNSAEPKAAQPTLVFTTLKRQEAERAGAHIGLATTLLVVDASGAYRGLVQYRLANATEQFLQLTLPTGARLWTAVVAGEPVKPAQSVPPQSGVVRVPLVKTAEGEGDYLVELKYGGRMATSLGMTSVQFPLIRQTSVHVELSQVRLLLPDSRQWFNFQGTMRRVVDESELAKGFQSYLGKRIQEASQALSSSNDYTKIRAAVNLKQSRVLLDNSRSMSANGNTTQLGLPVDTYSANSALLSQAEQQVQTELSAQLREGADNRGRLNEYFGQQSVQRAKNVVSQLGSNFDAGPGEPEKTKAGDALNDRFFEQNQLRTDGAVADAEDKKAAQPARQPALGKGIVADKAIGSRFLRGAAPTEDAKEGQAAEGKRGEARLPEIAAKNELDALQRRLADEPANEESRRRAGGEEGDQLQKYRQNLEQNLALGPPQALQGQQTQRDMDLPTQQNFGLQPPGGGMVGGGGRAGSGFNRDGNAGGYAMSGIGGQSPPSAPTTPQGMPMPEGAAAASGPAAAPVFNPVANAPAEISGEPMAQVAAGLASLDVQLPERGRLYQFTTPRGDIAITAMAISASALVRLLSLAGVLAAVLVGWLLGRENARRVWRRSFDSKSFRVALIAIGIASVLGGMLPVAGAALMVIGFTIIIRARMARVPAVHL